MEQYYDSFLDLALSLAEEYEDKTPAAQNVAELIGRAEERLGFSLSEQYKRFISHYDRIRTDDIEFHSIVSENMEGLDILLQMYKEGFPERLLPLANDCCYFLNFADLDEDGEPSVIELIEDDPEEGSDFYIEETKFTDLGEFLCRCMQAALSRRNDAIRRESLPIKRGKWLAGLDKQTFCSGTALMIKTDGSLLVYGPLSLWQQPVRFWKGLTAVKSDLNCIVGLTADGRVKVAGTDITGKHKAASWKDVKEISTGYLRVYALKKDGTVRWLGKSLIEDNIRSVESWTDIVSIYGTLNMLFGIRSDGTVICSEPSTEGLDTLTDVVRICCTDEYLFALSVDGNVTALRLYGEETSKPDLSAWKWIMDIVSDMEHLYGLTDDGDVFCLDMKTGATTRIPSWKCPWALFSDGSHAYAVDREGYIRNASGYVGTYNKDRWGKALWVDRVCVAWALESKN